MCGNWTWEEWLILFGSIALIWFAADTIATLREQVKCRKMLALMRNDLIILGGKLTHKELE